MLALLDAEPGLGAKLEDFIRKEMPFGVDMKKPANRSI
jgi:hypothetical protein